MRKLIFAALAAAALMTGGAGLQQAQAATCIGIGPLHECSGFHHHYWHHDWHHRWYHRYWR